MDKNAPESRLREQELSMMSNEEDSLMQQSVSVVSIERDEKRVKGKKLHNQHLRKSSAIQVYRKE